MSCYRFNGRHFVHIGLGRPISAIVLYVIITFVPLFPACETCHGIIVSTFLCDVVCLSTFSALANRVPCRFTLIIAAHCPPCGARNRPVSRSANSSIIRFFRRRPLTTGVSVFLTRFNKIVIQGTPQMAVDYEARAYRESTNSKCTLLFCS